MSEYSTIETEMDLGTDELTEQLQIITSLKNQNESITKELRKLKHDSEIKINDLNIQLEILQKKNKSLNEYNEAIKNSNTTVNSEFSANAEAEKQAISKLENYISDLESEKNLILNSKMDLERQVNNLLIENSNLKLDYNKLNVSSIKLSALFSKESKDKDLLDKSQYFGLSPELLMENLLEKDLQVGAWEAKFEDFERQAIELITEECNKNFLELKNFQESNNQLSEKLRETQNELLAKLKESEALAKDHKENTAKNQSNMQKRVSNMRRISNLHSNITPNNNTNNNSNFTNRRSTLLNKYEIISESDAECVDEADCETQSFNTEEVQVLVENYKELETKHSDLESEYEQKSKYWEFEMERLQNQFIDLEFSLKNKIEEMSRMNEMLRKEINDFEVQQLRVSRNSEETDNFLLLEIDNLKLINEKLLEQKEKIEFNFTEKIAILNKEHKEAEEFKYTLNNEKEKLIKDFAVLNVACAKKEKEIQDKNKFEVGYKENEIKELQAKLEAVGKETEIYKKDLLLAKNNYERLNGIYENLNKNYEKIMQGNKNEIERLKDEKDKIKNVKEFEISQLKKQAAELKEKLSEKENFIAENLAILSSNSESNGNILNAGAASLSDVLFDNESDNQIENLKAEISAKEEKINELNFQIEEFKNKINEKEKLEIEFEHAKAEISQQKTNLKSQKEIYEKQILQLQQKNIDINSDLLSHKRRTTSIKTDIALNSKQLAIFAEMDSSIKKLSGENKYLKDQLEIAYSEVEKVKNLKETDVNYFKQELLSAEKAVIDAKIHVATLAFDKDCEIVKYRNMYKKLRMKLQPQSELIQGNNANAGNNNINNKNVQKK
jgi:chromosome segregation ATPase